MGELRLERLLETCLASVASATGARSVSILLYDADEECLVVRARRGRDRRRIVGERCALGEGIAGWIAQHRVPLLIQRLEEQPVFRAMARNDGYESDSFAAVPLAWQERLLGVLCATDKAEGRSFDERDLRLLLGVATQIAIAIENARQHESLQQHAFDALRSLADSFEVKGGFARGHSERVATYATRTARELGLSTDEIETLRQAARLHDIGKVAISETLLGRSGPLSDNEFALVREHPLRSERILQSLGFLDAARPIVRHHHERWDGKGYPDSLKGREIDPMTRILTMADAFDAMTTPRPYRGTLSRAEAFAELAQCAGAQFDPRLVEPFRRAVAGLA
jgi:HD-GYP domain-containing protein (c-di-GMP phosphodiesterase class II)